MRIFVSPLAVLALASCAPAAAAPVNAPVAIDVAAPSASASAVQVLPTPAPSATEKKTPPVAFVGEKVVITVITPGSGPGAKSGDFLLVNYVGTLFDGTEFDSSLKGGRQPFKFKLGQGYVIKGWEEGVVGMQVGEKRKIVIPAALGYGDRRMSPKIPPGSVLVFEIELLAINPP